MRQYVDETASEKAHSAYTEAEVETEDSQCHLWLFSRALVSGETTSEFEQQQTTFEVFPCQGYGEI